MACHFHSFHKENTESVISYYLGLVNNQTDVLNRFCPATKKLVVAEARWPRGLSPSKDGE